MKSSKSQAPESLEVEGYEGHFDELDGYTVGFETYTADADLAPLFAGLPDDRCQCPHWGYVLKGRLTYRYADGTEDTIESGEAYYAPSGAHACAVRRDRGRRVQPHRRPAGHPGRRQQEHGVDGLTRAAASAVVTRAGDRPSCGGASCGDRRRRRARTRLRSAR